MRKFVFKISIFILIYFCLIGIFEALIPFNWGDNVLTAKVDWVRENPEKYNTLFLGSSRTYWQLIPQKFDAQTNGLTQSFNLGINGALFDETMYVLDNILEEKPITKHIEYIFFEINDVSAMKDHMLYTARQAYYVNWDIFKFMETYFGLFDNEMNREKARRIRLSFFQNLLKTNMLKNGIEFIFRKPKVTKQYQEEWMEGADPIYISSIDSISDTRKNFLADSTYLPDYAPKLKAIFDKTRGGKASHQVQFLIDTCNELIDKAEAKGIRLIFVNFLPNITTAHRRKVIFDGIDSASKINLEDPYRFPEFYQPKYFYDRYHLNGKGAELFSEKLGELFLEIN